MFYVGQKVVCVDASNSPGLSWLPGESPVEGRIYTVKSSHLDQEGDPVLWLFELPRHPLSHHRFGQLAGYHVRRFRPVVERKTDISIFTDMLKPKTEQVSA